MTTPFRSKNQKMLAAGQRQKFSTYAPCPVITLEKYPVWVPLVLLDIGQGPQSSRLHVEPERHVLAGAVKHEFSMHAADWMLGQNIVV